MVFSIVAFGGATIHDVLRCVDGCASVGAPWAQAGTALGLGYELFARAGGRTRRENLVEFIKRYLRGGLDNLGPVMEDFTGVASIIMDYWQGPDLLADLAYLEPENSTRYRRGCSHSFPCRHDVADGECVWMDQWTNMWVREARLAKPITDSWLAVHRDYWFQQRGNEEWAPDSWAIWDALRTHPCEYNQGAPRYWGAGRIMLDDEDDEFAGMPDDEDDEEIAD